MPFVADCSEARGAMSDLADGELHGRARWRVVLHLWMCRRCQAVWHALQATIAGLRELGSSEPASEPALAEAVVRRIRAERD
jgi:predicted anti-sigma-YlaC factor YlaD